LVTPRTLTLARQPGQDGQGYLDRLAVLMERQRAAAAGPSRLTLRLEDLHGQGAAGVWAQTTARDLVEYREGRLSWQDLPRGVLLVGPAGTGKTLLAQALAASAGVPLVSGSLARWQADDEGHLGTTLKAMRRTFDDARLAAPCVLLIDEVDSFGNRQTLNARHRDYSTQVINGLLELLDGAQPRDGVLVVATCNDRSNIDAAILRSGRLDQTIELRLPDAVALEAIFRLYLGADLISLEGEDAEILLSAARSAEARQATGADVERWCREARSLARAAGRKVPVGMDLLKAVGPVLPPVAPAVLQRAAIHEAGHALGFLACDPGMVVGLQLDRYGKASGTTELNREFLSRASLPTRADLLRHLRALLAGRAAEVILCGEASAGAGGSTDSDLARATHLARLMISRLGLSGLQDGLVWQGEGTLEGADSYLDPFMRSRIGELLAKAHEAAERLIGANQEGVIELSRALQASGSITAAAAIQILGPVSDEPVP